MVTTLIEGGSLVDRVKSGPLTAAEVVRHGAALAGALAQAHRDELLHSGIKPDNVLSLKETPS